MGTKRNKREEARMYFHGKIFTSDKENLYADAMIVEDGVIRWIGREDQAPEGTYRRHDLKGACVIPGLVDAHMHPMMLADYSRQISALPPEVHSIEELVEKIRERRKHQKPGQWIQGWGYDEGKFKEKRSLNRYDLDRGCSDAPVSIVRTCGHIRCVNSMALKLAGIDRNTPNPEGGEIERDSSGEPTGVLKESARNLVTKWLPEDSREDKIRKLVDLGNLLLSQGITAAADMGNLGPGDNLPLFREAARKGWKQKTAVYRMWEFFMEDPSFDMTEEDMDRRQQIFAAGLKLIGDGSVSGRTAWMKRPYCGKPLEYGMPVLTKDQMESAIQFCRSHQCQLSVHAMGTETIERIIDRVCREFSWMKEEIPYVRIEHVTDPEEESLRKAAEHNIAVVTQPVFMYAEVESYLENLGDDWMKQCYPVRCMLDQGVMLCFSTDAPATSWAAPSDPFINMKAAVTRKAYDGTDCGKEQAVDIETTVCLYTREAAKIVGFPGIGQLKQGFQADFAVLDRDIFQTDPEEVDETEVLETYIRGKRVYYK